MHVHIRPYLRASTDEQDAARARGQIEQFIADHGQGRTAAAWYVENASGARLDRPELFRLIADASPKDILLIEQVDRLSRLKGDDWDKLKSMLKAKQLRIVALDLPTSWGALRNADSGADDAAMELTDRVLGAVNEMLLDMLALFARKDYDDRRRRQEQGIAKAKSEGKFRGRREDTELHSKIRTLLDRGVSWSVIQDLTKASRSTIAKIAKRMNESNAGCQY